MTENNGKQNPEVPYTNKHHKHIACSYGYKLVCVDDKFSKRFKIYIGKDAVYDFGHSMIEESKYCNEVMEKHFNKELLMIKEDNEDFKSLLNVGSVIMIKLILMLKHEITVILLENIETPHITLIISISTLITTFLSYFTA